MQRFLKVGNPPTSPKEASPLRFGILGAARIGPDALILPARSHPGAIVAAVAARDGSKCAKYASKHGIARTYSGTGCYQKLIDDPELDVIYNPLPNSLHYEWTYKALQAGKHVLVEKPMADTAEEAAALVQLAEEKGLVLMEGIHWNFHPAAQRVKDIIQSGELGNITSIRAEFAVPSLLSPLFFLKDDVRFQYALGGGCMMDMGVYPLSAIRYFASSEPTITSATAVGHALDASRVDRAMHATFALPHDVTGELHCDFALPGWGPFGLLPHLPKMGVTIALEGGTLEYYGFPLPHLRSYVTVRPKRGQARTESVYKHPDGTGEGWWSSYRYQLEAFVAKVRGAQPRMWLDAQEPVLQLNAVGMIYEKAGMPPRPASEFFSGKTRGA